MLHYVCHLVLKHNKGSEQNLFLENLHSHHMVENLIYRLWVIKKKKKKKNIYKKNITNKSLKSAN